jgi:hypothetical protein
LKTEFLGQIRSLVGKCCWAVVAGQGNGSMVTLHLGGRVPRKKRLPGTHDPEGVQSYQGEYCLFVQGCAWRIQDGEQIIGGWAEPEQSIQHQVEKLVGCTITGVECLNNALDLRIQFASRYVLQLFCDRTLAEDELDNYALRTPHGWFSVGCRSRLTVEQTNVGARKGIKSKRVSRT